MQKIIIIVLCSLPLMAAEQQAPKRKLENLATAAVIAQAIPAKRIELPAQEQIPTPSTHHSWLLTKIIEDTKEQHKKNEQTKRQITILRARIALLKEKSIGEKLASELETVKNLLRPDQT